MRHRRLALLLVVLSLAPGGRAAGETPAADPAAPPDDSRLLAEWQGRWEGKLETLPASHRRAPSADVVLEVGPGPDPVDGCLTWRSTFTSKDYPASTKDYRLCRLPDGRFVTDEGGGLLLDTFVYGNVMYSAFKAQGTILFTATHLEGDRMIFDIYFANEALHPVPGIESYPGHSIQRTVFVRTAKTAP